MVNFPKIEPIEAVEREWPEELPILMVEPETRPDAHTEALPGVSELLESFEQLTMMKEQAK